jgi:23S rRNA (cytidine1920-2'-O)/16S rRNA (cytidine1409-2'-O)-methyltransferase
VLTLIQKKRLDCLIFDRGFTESREKAKAVIMEGKVYINGQKQDKPGTMFPVDVPIEVRGDKLAYVSRGGLKLEKALQVFPISLKIKLSWTLARLPADLQTACFKMVLKKFTQ